MSETPLILIIDDDLLLQRATARVLNQAGYRTIQASDGLTGLQMAREQKPELTLLDVNLPDINGFEVCRLIKADPALAGCFVVQLSGGRTDSESQVEGLNSGADGYIPRPVANAELLARVRGMLRIQQAEQILRCTKESLEQALAREQLLARTDSLTGINNRLYLFELSEHEFEVASRYKQPLSVILFDVDDFKQINDTYGHAVGDQVLRKVSQIACAEIRTTDIIGRIGGEEFVIILPMTNAGQAYVLADRIRNAVAATNVPTEKGKAYVTLSIGVVEFNSASGSASMEDLVRFADEAMYTAKNAGRNRTVISDRR